MTNLHLCSEIDGYKPRIELLGLNQAALIILFETGVLYENQTGGVYCNHRCAEGVLAPLTYPFFVTDSPTRLFQCSIEAGLMAMTWLQGQTLDETRADEIDELLQSNGFTQAVIVDRTRLKDSEEAWVYVKVKPRISVNYVGFGERDGVLVWRNSD